eukprot:CAMPEP_0176311080 /NCGR_PEP_ID=MMETSP0121_2-20121125/65951_1 /TAXON_ID=160619 /ORGANISM="Kryptoperidinium foliaceum, Strain CCMP 1326" /LENGTH=41 /DNA_ID= /DNA_START= /DNA_END= /DNA_ORIENTATION=
MSTGAAHARCELELCGPSNPLSSGRGRSTMAARLRASSLGA